MTTPSRLRRAIIAVAGAALLTVGVAGAGLAAGGDPDTNPGAAKVPDTTAVSAIFPAGSELQFVAVAPCRIIDTRKVGGALVAASRTFDATMTNYSTQGGKAGTCNIPDVAVSVQLNLGAISQYGKTSDIKGWATTTTEPTASMVNYNPSGPVANMVTMPVNASGQFTLKTPGAAHVFADVAGFYVRPLYGLFYTDGSIFANTASGVVSSTRTTTGHYVITFNRDIQRCSATASSLQWASAYDVSPDTTYNGNPNTVEVGVVDTAGTPVDAVFYLMLTC